MRRALARTAGFLGALLAVAGLLFYPLPLGAVGLMLAVGGLLAGGRGETRRAHGLLVLVLCLASAAYTPTRALIEHELSSSRAAACAANVSQLSHAVLAYASAHGTFPHGANWLASIQPYLGEHRAFACPNAGKVRVSYAYNSALQGVPVSQPDKHTVLIFESDRGESAVGQADLLPNCPRHDGMDRVSLVNGSSYWMRRERTHSGDWAKTWRSPAAHSTRTRWR